MMSEPIEQAQANDTVDNTTVAGPVLTTAEVAKKRGWQTLGQSLAIDVGVGVALAASTVIGPWQGWGDVQWTILGFAVAKSAVQAVVAWVIRRWGDKSTGTVIQ